MDRNQAFAAIVIAAMLVCIGSGAHAHKPLLSVTDNQDGTISVEAGFSDGASAAGHKIILKDEKTEAVISEHRVGEDGTLELQKPSVPYTVTLDAGEGHVVTKSGPPPSAPDKARASTKPEVPSPKAEPTMKPVPPEPARAGDALPASPGTGLPARPSAQMTSFDVGPGFMMAFKMMITTQIVTAGTLIILLAGIAYFVGYTMGKKSGLSHHE